MNVVVEMWFDDNIVFTTPTYIIHMYCCCILSIASQSKYNHQNVFI